MTYKELQTELKQLRDQGYTLQVRLNSKTEILQQELERIQELIRTEIANQIKGTVLTEQEVDDTLKSYCEFIEGRVYRHDYQDKGYTALNDLLDGIDFDTMFVKGAHSPWYVVNIAILKLMYFGEYTGSLVEKTNLEIFKEEILSKNLPGIYLTEWSYNTTFIYVDLRVLVENPNLPYYEHYQCLRGMFESLANYPLLSDDRYSELVYETKQDNWESWVFSDFYSELEKHFSHFEDIDKDTIEESVYKLFNYFVEDLQVTEWENEISDSMYIDLNPIIEGILEDKSILDKYELGSKKSMTV